MSDTPPTSPTPAAGMDPGRRRSVLDIAHNPAVKQDYVVVLKGQVNPDIAVEVRYIPDRWLLRRETLTAYLDVLNGLVWETPEALAAAVLDDLNNEVVPRWVQVLLLAPDGKGGLHEVLMVDRQPRWDNKALLDRLRRV